MGRISGRHPLFPLLGPTTMGGEEGLGRARMLHSVRRICTSVGELYSLLGIYVVH